ncbi:MAG TPA: alanine racemase [Chloroflexia bacterium]|nr:alanine racemase [Chloroflexia bacterium]
MEIDLSAVSDNVRAVKQWIGPHCNVMAVVKADGYGLGAIQMAGAAQTGGATWLAVACVDEAVQLRNAGFDAPVLVMGYIQPSEAATVVARKLTPIVHCIETALALERAAVALGLPGDSVAVHIKVDTGLGRFGCLPDEFLPLAESVAGLPHLRLEGLMTHFAEADSTDLSFAHEQLARFASLQKQAEEHGLHFDFTHASNSAATLALPGAHFDLVRTGILLSGHLPAAHLAGRVLLRSALTLRSKLARVYEACTGDSVGYGRTWVAQRPSIVGLVPLGYADGFRRTLSNKGAVLVRGVLCPVIGRVSMDQFSVDLTDVGGALEGDEVVLIGKQGDQEITADEVADWAGTISYEIFTGIARRVPRRYVRNGETVEIAGLLASETFEDAGMTDEVRG